MYLDLRSQFSHTQLWRLPHFQGNKVPVCCGFFHGMLGNCSYLMVIDPNKQIAFTNLRAKAFPQAAAGPGRRCGPVHKLSWTWGSDSPGPQCWAEWFPHSPSTACTYTDQGSSNRGRRRSRSCTDPTTYTPSLARSRDSELRTSVRKRDCFYIKIILEQIFLRKSNYSRKIHFPKFYLFFDLV